MTTFVVSTLEPAHDWPAWIVGSSLGLSALLLAILIVTVKCKAGSKWLTEHAPSPKWSFDSWALHLAAVGGVLGTVFGAITFPEEPTQISKESVVALSLLFGALVVVAPFIYEAIRCLPKTPVPSPEEAKTGFVCVLLLACVIVFCGAFGELFTLGVVAWELTGDDLGGIASEIGLGILSGLAFYYVGVSAWEAALSEWPGPDATDEDQAAHKDTVPVMPPADQEQARPSPRASWSLP
jgi:hypothetical protein